ncbi:helix-turn-helix domain-containing protein [Aestuariispira ectoiniformans]|uniref:helix-turn-helix domain-containing protein n=1 Tax=Aestuariispira ectoiniformans TaxID=2775080 RepID=UPI00223B3739|nr:helix-turn-helix transcriptional regulator [Aestuariispira ectoiniformans]
MNKNEFTWAKAGEWLKGLREEWLLTRAELAEQVGAPSVNWLGEIEEGERALATDLFKGFARSFNMSVQDFAKTYAQKAHVDFEQAA